PPASPAHRRRRRQRRSEVPAPRRGAAASPAAGPGPGLPELVRLGVLGPRDPRIVNTVHLVDQHLGYQTRNGPFWHRASFDGYGEKADGSQWQSTNPGSHLTHGRGWPLLTGERGEYQLAAGAGA